MVRAYSSSYKGLLPEERVRLGAFVLALALLFAGFFYFGAGVRGDWLVWGTFLPGVAVGAWLVWTGFRRRTRESGDGRRS